MSMELEKSKSIEKEKKKKIPFHPTDQPHGSKIYDLDALEVEQLEKLKDQKLLIRQENELYLKNHPEIRGLISILLRNLLTTKPRNNHLLQEYIGAFFKNSRESIVKELHQYLVEIKCKDQIVKELEFEVREAEFDKSYSII